MFPYEHFVGQYLLLPSTSFPHGKSALISLPDLKPDYHGQCFEFFYFIFGEDVGELKINMMYQETTWNLWKLYGNQQPDWQYGRVRITFFLESETILILSQT